MGIGFDVRTITFLRTIGLTTEDPTPQDLLEFNIRSFDWTDVRDLGEVEIFGTTAVVARVTDPFGEVAIQYMGLLPAGALSDDSPDPDDEALIFLFGFGAPTAEEVDAFLPAWETVIESITATEWPKTEGQAEHVADRWVSGITCSLRGLIHSAVHNLEGDGHGND